MGNVSCSIPAYSQPLFEVNGTEDNARLLVAEGRCYLSCLIHFPNIFSTVSVLPAWPFAALEEIINCEQLYQLHECTRGCRILLLEDHPSLENITDDDFRQECTNDCLSECREECGGARSCENPDLVDTWITRAGCTINCLTVIPCSIGCLEAQEILDADGSTPLSPVHSPGLTELIDPFISIQRGLVSVNITDTDGDITNVSDPQLWNGFIFRIHDLMSTNVTFIWQTDPREPLDLSSHICRDVEVSFSVVNKYGMSNFSEVAQIYISGDERQIPNPPVLVNVRSMIDTRIGFFQYVTIQVDWIPHEVDTHLEFYEVALERVVASYTVDVSDVCIFSNGSILTAFVDPTMDGEYTTTFEGDATLREPLMGRTYILRVTSVGDDGNRSVCSIHSTASLQAYSSFFLGLSCSGEITSVVLNPEFGPATYFAFQLEWMLPPFVAFGNSVESFNVTGVPLYSRRSSSSEALYPFFPINIAAKSNETVYNLSLGSYNTLVSVPNLDPVLAAYEFTVTLFWNNLVIATEMSLYKCIVRYSALPPSEIRNFTVVNVTLADRGKAYIQASWVPPLEVNGILKDYQLCLSRNRLENRAEPESGTFCVDVASNVTSIDGILEYFAGPDDIVIYFQIRPSNTLGMGQWSEAYDIYLVSTTEPEPESNVTTFSSPTKILSSIEDITTDLSEVKSSGLSSLEIVAVVIGLLLPIAIASCFAFLIPFIRNIRKKRRLMNLTTDAVPYLLPVMRVADASSGSLDKTKFELDPLSKLISDEWELCPSDITVEQLLGEGAFGEVYKGFLKGPLSNTILKPEFRNLLHIPVAIKLLKDTTKGSERRDFVSEIEMMKKVSAGHNPHVVTMLGCVATQEPLCLVTEFVEYGDLLSYLRSSRQMCLTGFTEDVKDPYIKLGKVTVQDLPSFSYQIAAGMAYLSSIGVVHRDLACRNVLVSSDKALKITDFGLSRETDEDLYVQQSTGRVPFKWMAIESIVARQFTSASDVWAFGVVLWEIGTVGGVPYPGVGNADLLPLLKAGHRMEKPENCTTEEYEIMLSCWAEDPSQRPTFQTLKSRFNDILLSKGSESYVDFNIDPDNICYKDDDILDIDFCEDDFELPPLTNVQTVPTNARRGRSISVTTLPQLVVQQRRISESAAPDLSSGESSRKTSLLDKFKNKILSPPGDDLDCTSPLNFNLSQQSFSATNPELVMGDVSRYVSNPAVTMRMSNGILEDNVNGILGAPIVILTNTESHSQ